MIIKKDKRISTIYSLSKQAFGKYKLQIIILTILGFVGGLLEGIGVNALIPLLSFITGGDNGNDVISQYIEKFFIYLNISFSLKYLLVFVCLLFIFKAIALVIFTYIRIKIVTDYEQQTRSCLFDKTLKASWPYLIKQKIGYLENILMKDVEFSSGLLQQISSVIMGLTSLFIYILIAINVSVYITLITLSLGAMLFLLFKPLIYKTRLVAYKSTNLNKQITHFINENIIGLKTLKSMSVSSPVNKIADNFFNIFKKLRVKVSMYKSITGSLLQPISLVFICLVLAFSYKTPNFHFAAFMVVIYLIQRIFQYIQQLQLSVQLINESYPYLNEVLNYEKQVLENKEISVGKNVFKFNDTLEFLDISFGYNRGKEVLSKINFNIKKKEMIGLIGPSGAGKTTVVDLILRLLNPKEGKILLDGRDISEINIKEWRENIGYVSQDIFLMNDTIANNIRFYDNSITQQEIEKASKMANIFDFIQSCPDKFNTEIGERGVLLSNGQRQRIIIARILARQPELIILDEATSALDNESEVKIQKVIENLKGKMTVIVIAHRLSTVINSDRLLVLEKGKIIEQGSPRELLNNKESYFYKVYNIRK
ncbi:ABC transporter ATP-binding protein/permease [Patescibacteria group bacterium]|nr:ABC transporter ATP-binding protein/permease [Patescibacteria group bacterium]